VASPEHKARIVRGQRRSGDDVALLGDGVQTRWPCTRPTSESLGGLGDRRRQAAADVILLEKDLDVLADGIIEGRRILRTPSSTC
jgi:P-type Mg2+ transporter